MQDLIKADEANNTNDCVRVCVKSYSVLSIFFIMLFQMQLITFTWWFYMQIYGLNSYRFP